MHIIFRTCDVVNAVNNSPRPFGLDKKTLIKICFKSLYHAVQEIPHHITVLGDKLSDEMVDFFKGYNVQFSNGNYGNDESIRQCIKIAAGLPDEEWVYFCEDDYLHKPETFRFIANLIAEKETVLKLPPNSFLNNTFFEPGKTPIVIFPPDYPDRYAANDIRQYYILHSSDCHWRQVTNITFTFIAQAKTIKKHLQLFNKSSVGANDGLLSKKLFGYKNFKNKALCLSPLPGLSTHMHADTITPLVDWKALKDHYLNL